MPVPEIEAVNEPLVSPSPSRLPSPSPSAGVDRTSTTLFMLFQGLFAGRRGSSWIVRQNVAFQLDSWREDFGYSLPVVVVDTIWNLAFVIVSVAMLNLTASEEPIVTLRVWLCGYSFHCVVNVILMWLEYTRRNSRITTEEALAGSGWSFPDRDTLLRWEMHNMVLCYLWWALGVICMYYAYNHGARRLVWLTLAFFAIDMFFAAIRLLFTCFLGLAVCFCFPCIMAVMYFIHRQEAASEADIRILPKYRCEKSNDEEQPDGGTCRMVPMETNGPDFSVERLLPAEDADCCICLCQYEDGEELRVLPCTHHFHSACIMKWLRVKATCPLCKSRYPARNEQG